MMTKPFKQLMAAARRRVFTSERDVDRWLDQHGVRDPELRIAAKVELQAAGELATDQTTDFRLATDTAGYQPETPPLNPQMAALFRRAGVRLDRSYTHDELSNLFLQSGLDDVTHRM